MQRMVNKSFAKRLVTERTNRDPRDLLQELYVERRHSQQEIADFFASIGVEISRATVSGWLLDYGISREARGPVELKG